SASGEARGLSESAKLRDLVAWCWIRESWLALKGRDRAAADRAATSARRVSAEPHIEALATLEGMFSLLDGKHLDAAKLFGELSRAYLERSDLITAVALLFWRSVAYRAGHASKGAKGAARAACARLVAAHPRAVSRDELTDTLWPDSDGDKAVRNLYGAVKDLRRTLSAAPGVTLVARGGGYALEVGTNVTVTR